jgi:hypothetical protein
MTHADHGNKHFVNPFFEFGRKFTAKPVSSGFAPGGKARARFPGQPNYATFRGNNQVLSSGRRGGNFVGNGPQASRKK